MPTRRTPGSSDPSTDAERLAAGEHGEPFAWLGPHAVRAAGGSAAAGTGTGPAAIAVRAFLPEARGAVVRWARQRFPMTRLHPAGVFEAVLPTADPHPRYRLELTLPDGTRRLQHDPGC
jgi:1,4-alpha-glucan branching enzyme